MVHGHRKRSGFTLIELLVVVSIIALLISILLPAIGEVRRNARISNCTSNMKQHSTGMHNFAAANNDELPNAPKSPGGTLETLLGPKGSTSYRHAGEDFAVNGFEWGAEGLYTLPSPAGIEMLNKGTLDGLSCMHDLYWVVMSEYMVDGEGMAAMQDIFISPSDTVTRGWWNNLLDYVKLDNSGNFPAPEQAPTPAVMGGEGSPGSYRYSLTAVMNPKVALRNPRTGGYADTSYSQYLNSDGVLDQDAFRRFHARNTVADVDYPSNKVMFYMWNAWHNAELDAWFQDGASIPVGLADGSARSTQPFRDALARNNQENAGPIFDIYFTADPTVNWPGHYFINNGGIKGRDLP